jgi:hypothetical protein
VPAGQRPRAEVDAQLDDAGVLVAVGGEGQGQRDASILAVEMQDDLFDPAPRRDDEVDVLDGDVAVGQPGLGVGGEALERRDALHVPAYRVMQLRLPGERPGERVDLPRDQAVEERHRRETLAATLVQYAFQDGGGEQLRYPGHARKDSTDTPPVMDPACHGLLKALLSPRAAR